MREHPVPRALRSIGQGLPKRADSIPPKTARNLKRLIGQGEGDDGVAVFGAEFAAALGVEMMRSFLAPPRSGLEMVG